MSEFLQADYFADVPDAVINDLQRKLRDDGIGEAINDIVGVFNAEVRRNYARSFWLDADKANKLVIFQDGSAEDDDRTYSGAPSLAEFIEYVRSK